MSIRLLIADDQELVRVGFRLFLESREDLEVAGEAGDGGQAIARARALRPDVVLMDIRMPRIDGVEATARLTSGEIEPAPRVLVSPPVTRRLIEHFAARPEPLWPAPDVLDALTPRERETLLLVARGLSNREIADRLVVTEATVKSHVGALLLKLGLRDRVQVVVFAYEHGIVTAGHPG